MKTATLILNWNGANDTIQCLQSLAPALTSDDYLFIIDNGSSDNSVQLLSQYFAASALDLVIVDAKNFSESFKSERKNYLFTGTANIGFGAGNNLILKRLEALPVVFEFAWLLNNDTVVTPRTLESLRGSMDIKGPIAVAGSLILNYPDNQSVQCSGVKYHKFLGVSKLINKNKPLKELKGLNEISFDYLNGASLFCRVKALSEIGFFDERFFLYSEEYDLQLRLQKKGYQLLLVPSSIVYHKLAGGTSKKKYLFYFYYCMSALQLSKKHFNPFITFCVSINMTAITFVRAMPSLKNFVWGVKGVIKGLRS